MRTANHLSNSQLTRVTAAPHQALLMGSSLPQHKLQGGLSHS